MTDGPLEGGITNAGKVSRSGPHVLRPAKPNSPSIHAYLRALIAVGFRGVPEPISIDEDGVERLTFVDGDVPTTPYPLWSQSNTALVSITRLIRDLHDNGRGFDADDHRWDRTLADPFGGTVMCHNDVELSNVVFRNGVAVALIDFEYAAPGRPVYDLAQMARLCVPIEDDFDKARMGWEPADGPARLRLIADTYGLNSTGRAELMPALDDVIDRMEALARSSVERNGQQALSAMEPTGGIEKYDRRRQWWTQHREAFAASLL